MRFIMTSTCKMMRTLSPEKKEKGNFIPVSMFQRKGKSYVKRQEKKEKDKAGIPQKGFADVFQDSLQENQSSTPENK